MLQGKLPRLRPPRSVELQQFINGPLFIAETGQKGKPLEAKLVPCIT